MIVDEKKIPKDKSLNSTYNETDKWKNSKEVIKLTEQNGGKETTVEIPAGGVRAKIFAQEKQIQTHKAELSISSKSSFGDTVSSSSEIFISSQQSDEENHDVQKNPKKSRIPIRSNSSASSSSNNSIASHTRSYETPSGIPILKGSSLFKKEPLKDNKENWYKINEAESWILISPELLDLVKAEKLIKETDSRKANALTYRETDKVRLMDLTEKEILILKENLPRLCERLKGNEKINIFRN